MERVAELVRFGRLLALPAPTGAVQPVAPERVPSQPAEQIVEHLLADPARAARRQLHPIAVALEVAGPLEAARKLIEGVHIAGSVGAEQVADPLTIDLAKVARAVDAVQLRLEGVERLEVRHLLQGAFEAERLVAAEPGPLAEAAGQQLVERCRELSEVPAQPVVAQQRVHHRLELGPLLRAHRAQQRLHRGHPLRQLGDDVVEGLRAREEPAVLAQEVRDVGIAAGQPLLEQSVEVADHVAIGGEVLGRDALDRVRQPGHVLVEDLLAEALDELVEPPPRLGLHEVVFLEAADPVAEVRRQPIELVEAPRGHLAQHRPQLRIGQLVRAGRSSVRGLRSVGVSAPAGPGPVSGRARLRSASGAVGRGASAAVGPDRPIDPRPAACAASSRRRCTPARSSATIDSSSALTSASVSPRLYRSSSSRRRCWSRWIRSCSPAMSGRVGSPELQPRSISRRSAASTSPSLMRSSAIAARISSASRSGSVWVPSQRE